MINTVERPLGLLLGINLWAEIFSGTWPIAVGFLIVVLLLSALFLPKTREVFSIGTTGFVIGIYSIALLLVYQSTYGLLYSRVSLLLCCLTLGFMGGTLIRRIPMPDLFIGLFCLTSLLLLSHIPYPPALLFYCAHTAAGVLAGNQFASMKNTSAGVLYAADCLGGALGMAITVVAFPLFGIISIAAGLCAIKCLVGGIGKMEMKNSPYIKKAA
jgi:hypothetical protein